MPYITVRAFGLSGSQFSLRVFKSQDHPTGDVTRVSVIPRKDTVKIGDAENQCRGCRDKNR